MVIPVANLSAVVAGAVEAAKAVATEVLPAAVTRDAVVDAARASAAWLVAHLSAWLAAAADTLPTGVTAAAEASGPWLQPAARLLGGLYARLAAAAAERLPGAAAERLMAWLAGRRGGAAYALLAAAFLGGAVCVLTCRTMKAPGLGGARVPRAVFRASPKRYYAAVRAARKALRGAGGGPCRMVSAGIVVAAAAYLAAKMIY
ncbi:hypothetical protein BS78_01G323100 [Paspalum vaginatum]|nr:hypothetical protein BS78_01G323100 [Paspalum vaginatum]